MQLGETIATYDVALALRGENGKFDVTSPSGDMFQVTSKPNHAITNLQWAGCKSNSQPFLIRKVAEPVFSTDNGPTSAVDATTQDHPSPVPFLVGPDAKQTLAEEIDTELLVLDLFYEAIDDQSQRPSARVSVCRDSAKDRGRSLTSVCTTFNELDAELRRLHARLDDIRYRARKKFYEAQAIAAGA